MRKTKSSKKSSFKLLDKVFEKNIAKQNEKISKNKPINPNNYFPWENIKKEP